MPNMKRLVFGLLIMAGASSAQTSRTFTGAITDSMCATADHSRMGMGSTNGECTIACVDAHAARYVLFDGKDVYALSDQKTPERFAGKKVAVTGKLKTDTRTIEVEAIALAR
jgi:uncharacterized protein DUF5818